ncbi:MAG: DUF3320 domain-containing protein, partial [gamma proteobacterium symbiont of Bathyaustriella thionipta]|nr:DUF3320 domain-containing protein [gamma proteobacterium symbiont of Bathyaustriella thionipta]
GKRFCFTAFAYGGLMADCQVDLDFSETSVHELTPQQLFGYVSAVIEVESPVHKTEIIRRITEGSSLKRAGKRIQTSVSNAIRYGVQARKIQLKGDFVWLSSMEKAEVRDRSELDSSSKRFDYVPPEEISSAILQEVERGFSLAEDEAMSNAAGAMGFHRLTAQSKKLFKTQISLMIENKSLEKRDGFISIVH